MLDRLHIDIPTNRQESIAINICICDQARRFNMQNGLVLFVHSPTAVITAKQVIGLFSFFLFMFIISSCQTRVIEI